MPLYTVTLEQVQRVVYEATLEIEANSEAEAREKAFAFVMDGEITLEPRNWQWEDDEPMEAYARLAEEAE
jgi:hypothetical protein